MPAPLALGSSRRGPSRAVLIGFESYRDPAFPDLHAVPNNILEFRRFLTGPSSLLGFGEDDIRVISSPSATADSVIAEIDQAAQEATDLLLVYYSGHGAIPSRRSDLHLVLRDTVHRRIQSSAVSFDQIREFVAYGPPRRIIIVDCCMSGRAIGVPQSASILDAMEVSGTAVLAACRANEKAIAPEGGIHTAFTGQMLKLLEDGIRGRGEFITVTELFNAMRIELVSQSFPEPQLGLRNRGGDIPFARNNAWSPKVVHTAVPETTLPDQDAHASVRITITGLPEELAFEGALLRVTGRVTAPTMAAVDEAAREVQALIHGESGPPGTLSLPAGAAVSASETSALSISTSETSAPKGRRNRQLKAARRKNA